MVRVRVKVCQPIGRAVTYTGLFASTMDAVLDALTRFGMVKVTAKALKSRNHK